MEPRSLQFVAQACGGTLVQGRPDQTLLGVCTDSRRVQPQDLFVALRGERFDGHAFLEQAAAQGAGALLIDAPTAHPPAGAVVRVDDTRLALGRLAAAYRRDFPEVPLVAVAGSNGKTTTKNLLAALLEQKGPTLSSPASYNNDIGVPLTLLRLHREHQAGVLEAGTNHPGELAPLLDMMGPRHGILTALGPEHLEFFGSFEGVAQEEGWLAQRLPAEGHLFVHGDSPGLDLVLPRARARVIRAGLDPANDWWADAIALGPEGTRFVVHSPEGDFDGPYAMRLLGRHQVGNALLALAAARHLGLSPEQARVGLASCPVSPMRMEYVERNGMGLINDTYNANVPSMRAALATCSEMPCGGRRLALLGDMAELGRQSEAAHAEVGRAAAEAGIDLLVTVGRWASTTARAARAAGLEAVREFPGTEEAAAWVAKTLRPGDLVLLKASRAARLERLVEGLEASLG